MPEGLKIRQDTAKDTASVEQSCGARFVMGHSLSIGQNGSMWLAAFTASKDKTSPLIPLSSHQ